MSIMLAGLAPQFPSGPAVSEGILNTKAANASGWLTSIVIGFSTTAGLGAIGAMVGLYSTGSSPGVGISFASITGSVLLLRAGSHSEMPRSLPLVVSGTITISIALVVAAAAYPPQTPYLAAASMLLALVVLCIRFMNHGRTISPIARRSVELLEYLGLAAVVPLAFWICGLYGATRGLSLP
jgi:type VII secretion integral membrane protein EccD